MKLIYGIPATLVFFCTDVLAQEQTPSFVAQPTVAVAKVITGLVLVLFLIAAFAWISKRLGVAGVLNAKDNMRILGVLSLGTREKAVLVDIEGQKLLLGVAPGRVSQLHVFEKSDSLLAESQSDLDPSLQESSVPKKNSSKKDFAVYLKQIITNGSDRL